MSARIRAVAVLLIFVAVFCVSCGRTSDNAPATASTESATQHPTIVFMTDFGTANDAVAICRAVIWRIVPDARIADITHQVTPFSIEEGARFLTGVTPYYPSGTVFLVVIDPGVGTSRKAVIVKSKKGQYFVLPDNGLITPVLDRDGFEAAYEITNRDWMIESPVSSTFHGRDIFSPAAAHLAAGWDYTQAGPKVPQLLQLTQKTATLTDRGISGDIIGLDDPFGSLISNISADDFAKLGYQYGEKVTVQLNKKPITLPYVKTFLDVSVGHSLLYRDSRGRMAIAVNQGNYSKKFNVNPPASLFIPKKGA
jgi:S-adenosyl-L-methionine hydrolase (adenosine-forming)